VPIALLQDLQGPKIRIGSFREASVDLVAGRSFTITTRDVEGTVDQVSTSLTSLPSDVRAGDTVLLDDGKIQLRAVKVTDTDVQCEVVVGGPLSARKGINLPGVAVSAPSFTEKDVEDLAFGLKEGIDYVALSFVRSAVDVRDLRRVIAARAPGASVPVIAKIEKPQAIANIDTIIAEADGIMVARGDLGVESPPEDVPMLQKEIIRKCNAAGKPVIIATQMLESMVANPRPTRAEASDVANAVMDGGDAVMLSGETSVGAYPVETVSMMDRIIRRAEETMGRSRRGALVTAGVVLSRHDALGQAACVLAEQMSAAAIVAVTRSGQTARVLARYRPDVPIVAITDSERTLRRLALVWGVRGMVVENLPGDSDEALQVIQERLLADGVVERGANIVMLAGQPFFARGSTNFIKVERIG
jgi:pyruvate kinase